MGVLWQDIRYGLRMLARSSGFTIVVVLILAVGIGANTAIFSFVDDLLLRPLPVERPHELVTVVTPMDHGGVNTGFNYPLYVDYRDQSRVFAGLIAYSNLTVSLRLGDAAEQVNAMIVSGNYFSVLGVNAALGRTFLPEEDRTPATHPVAVVSHRFWWRRFGADPSVVGKEVRLNGHPFTIIGVTPSEFYGTIVGFRPDLYVPMMTQPWVMPVLDPRHNPLQSRTFVWLNLLGRLKPGVSREQAQAAMRVLAAQIEKVAPMNTDPNVLLQDGSRGHGHGVKELRLPLVLLMAMVGLVLLVACANIANLLLARAMARQKEIVVRLAVGASRGRVIRQLLSESLLLAVIGGGCGLLVAIWVSHALVTAVPVNFPVHLEPSLDARVLLFALVVSLATGVVFGLAPAWQASRPDLVPALKEGAVVIEVLRRRWNLRNLLVIGQVALSLMVLVCAGLCGRSLGKLQAIELGFEPTRVLVVSVDVGLANYDDARGRRFFADLSERVATLPGVEAVSLTEFLPLGGRGGKHGVVRIENYEIPPGQTVNWNFSIVSPDYFRTLRMPLLRGRDFTEQDAREAPKVIIINEALAQRYWPNQDPVGKRVWLYTSDKDARDQNMREVVGVVKDGKFRELREAQRFMMYWPLAQSPFSVSESYLLVRTTGDPKALLSAVREVVRSLDPDLPVLDIFPLAEQKSRLLAPQRMVAVLLGAFGLLGLLLAAAGIYGVMAYAVSQRTREIGIRMALGAETCDVLGLVLRHALLLVLIGVAIGSAAALVFARLLRSFLYEVSPGDPVSFIGTATALSAVALLASYIPARRAAKVDPMVALRYE